MTIYNVKIHTMNMDRLVIDNGYVSFKNGIITEINEGKPSFITDCDYDGNGCDL